MRQVTKYTAAIKASVLSKVLASNGPSIIELAKEFNIPKVIISNTASTKESLSATEKMQDEMKQLKRDLNRKYKHWLN